MLDRAGLVDLAEIIQLKGEIKAKRGEAGAEAFFEVAEGLLSLAADQSLPPLVLSVPNSGREHTLATLAVALVTGHMSIEEYVEAAAIWMGREKATERAHGLCHMKATATS